MERALGLRTLALAPCQPNNFAADDLQHVIDVLQRRLYGARAASA